VVRKIRGNTSKVNIVKKNNVSTVRGYGIFEGIENEMGLEEIENNSALTLEFKCKKCGAIYEYECGKISINTEKYKGEFEKEPICPNCKAEESWELTFWATTIANEIMNKELEKLEEE
jgi:hypothetical protein